MVELIEYVIIFGISAGVAGASVMLVNSAMPGLNVIAAHSKSDQIAGAARISALEGRTVSILIPLRSSSVSCAGGSMSLVVDGIASSYDLGYPCAFAYRGLSGDCTLTFSAPEGSLLLEAGC